MPATLKADVCSTPISEEASALLQSRVSLETVQAEDEIRIAQTGEQASAIDPDNILGALGNGGPVDHAKISTTVPPTAPVVPTAPQAPVFPGGAAPGESSATLAPAPGVPPTIAPQAPVANGTAVAPAANVSSGPQPTQPPLTAAAPQPVTTLAAVVTEPITTPSPSNASNTSTRSVNEECSFVWP